MYSWRVPIYSVSAKQAGEVMKNVADRNGGVLTAKNLLDESRPEDAPLHNCFEWRDDVAAEKYRLDQSRRMILNLEIHRVENNVERKVSVFLNVSSNRNTAEYKETSVAFRNENDVKVVLNNALSDCRSLMQKCKTFAKIAENIGVVEQSIIDEINSL